MTDENYIYNDFKKVINVPRETFLVLEDYVSLLKKWQRKINLVSDTTLSDVWTRHIIDSAQLKKYLPDSARVVDIGSGAGFPGLVLAALGMNMILVESDNRKAAFLREAARTMGLEVDIVCERIEKMPLHGHEAITARAFASTEKMFNLLKNNMKITHRLLILKGKNYMEEIQEAQRNWSFEYKKYDSITNPEGAIIEISNVHIKE